MSGLLKVDTIERADGKPVDLTGQNAAKAWASIQGSGTQVIRDSLNFSSVSDLGTGKSSLSFTQSMSNSDYAVLVGGNRTDSFSWAAAMNFNTRTVNIVEIYGTNVENTLADFYDATCAIHGELA